MNDRMTLTVDSTDIYKFDKIDSYHDSSSKQFRNTFVKRK